MFDPILASVDDDPDYEQPIKRFRHRVRGTLVQQHEQDRGKRPYAARPSWSLPASAGRGRPSGVEGQCIPHTRNRVGGHSAASGPVAAKANERYIRRDEEAAGETELTQVQPVHAIEGDRYLNRLETDAIGNGGLSALRTNMDPDPMERDREWTARTRHERQAGLPRINIKVERDPALCRQIADDQRFPMKLRIAIAADLDRYQRGRKRPKSKKAGEPWIDEQAAKTFCDIADAYPINPDAADPALAFGRPRAGRVFYKWEAELPRGLSEPERQTYLDDMAADLDRIGIRFVLVMHRPDALNHPDNFHCHLLYADRPVDKDADGTFDIERTIERDYGRGRRRTVHNRQPKLRLVSERSWTQSLRNLHVAHCNAALERTAANWRYNAGGFAEIGLEDEAPQRKLGTAAARYEAAGVATDIGVDNALIDWDRVERLRNKKHARRLARIAAVQAGLQARLAQPDAATIAEWHAAAERAEYARVAAEELEDTIAMATSRPRDVIEKAGSIAASYAGGSYERDRWQMRCEEAHEAERQLGLTLVRERDLLAAVNTAITLERRERDRIRQDIGREPTKRRLGRLPELTSSRTPQIRLVLSSDPRQAHRFINQHAAGPEIVLISGRPSYPPKLIELAGLSAKAFDDPQVARRLSALHERQRTEIMLVTKLSMRGFELDARSDTPHVRKLIERWRNHPEVRNAGAPASIDIDAARLTQWRRAAAVGNRLMNESDEFERSERLPSGRLVREYGRSAGGADAAAPPTHEPSARSIKRVQPGLFPAGNGFGR